MALDDIAKPAPAKRNRREGVFDRWHTREELRDPDGRPLPAGCSCRFTTTPHKPAARHGVGKQWTARYVDDKGREVSKGFDTKRAAQAHLREQSAALTRGDYIAPERGAMTFDALAELWKTGLTSRSASTARSYESVLDTHILPRWRGVKLADIEHGDLATWIAGLTTERGLSPSTVKKCHVITRMILDLAVRDGRMPRNPCDGVPLPRARRASQRFLSRDELARLVSAADHLAGERDRAQRAGKRVEPVGIERDDKGRNVIPAADSSLDGLMVRTLAATGIRWGELAGLRITCVDLDKRRMTIRASVSEVGGALVWSDTKNHTARSVAFPSSLVEPLREQIGDRADDELVFPSRSGEPIRNPAWSKRVFRPAVELAQLTPLTPHDLRDTYASLAIRAGASVKDVQRQLGHASAAMTLDVYSGLFEDGLDAVADALGDI
ncbi:tyrosine-type recombinase/integrase [Rhodococcus hoagii]|nr:tyrosine-type recombinase/integrase [Prescottella equi]NKT16084.1 tyrosine-type recombinase/integrase [Prescottella equi]NKW48677.1 tyrosine-type recombinase/integrase [Prescottella equi]NKZ68279.1 tyrosine-type recombinase/integrase [Prescottella equi]